MMNNLPDPTIIDFLLVRAVDEEFRARRTDCVEQGWNPEFSPEVVCNILSFSHITGVKTGRNMTTYNSRGGGDTYPTKGNEHGDILIHLSAMPFDPDYHGCMYYTEYIRSWAWVDQLREGDSEIGFVNAQRMRGYGTLFGFEPCNNLVRILAERALATQAPERLEVMFFTDLVRRVQVFSPDYCGEFQSPDPFGIRFWNPISTSSPAPDCDISEPTGVRPGGGLVIHWSEDGQATGASCWILTPDGEWVS